MIVYLSGGFKSDWQDRILFNVHKHDYIDPRSACNNGLVNPQEYTAADLLGIRRADILVCYMERDNTFCAGLLVELGYAKALNKLIILVIDPEHPIPESQQQFARICADVVYDDLKDAMVYLNKIQK